VQYTYTDTVDGVAQTHLIEMDDAALQALAVADAARAFPPWLAQILAPASLQQMSAAYDAEQAAPRYVNPGGFAADNEGAVLSLDASGKVFRNGVRLGAAIGSRALVYGNGLFVHGASDGKWWEWTGSAWSLLSGVRELDPAIFTS